MARKRAATARQVPQPYAEPVFRELDDAGRERMERYRQARAARRIGEERDACNPCKLCDGDRVEILTEITEKGTHVWLTRCYHCRPRAESETSPGGS